jgi:hypothetical protein
MRLLRILTVLILPGLGLAADRYMRETGARRMLWVLLALGCASAQLLHLACWLVGLGRIHAAVAALCWLTPLFFGVRSARAQGPASGPRGPIPRAPASA